MQRIAASTAWSRRRFLASGVAAAAAAPWLSGCRSTDGRDLIVALGWVHNVEYADLFVAEARGYFAQEHCSVKVWPGGPNAPQPVIAVAARLAHMGDAEWLPLLDAVLRGNDFVIIGSIFPVHPGGLMSLAKRPVRTPADLPGTRFLVQGPSERTTIEATFKLNHLAADYQLIPVGYSPDALLNGAGDAYYCFITNQPIVFENLGLKRGTDFFVTRLDELGYKVPSTLLFVERQTLKHRRQELVGFLRARLRGKIDNEKDPAYAANLAVDRYGADLGLEFDHELRTNTLQLPLYQTPGSRGPYWISDESLRKNMYGAAIASGRINLPDPSRIMDMTLLEEVYASLGI
jgi:ABC-type nitrate/sulfonate/bicarbonate transport system substrate-binding protein